MLVDFDSSLLIDFDEDLLVYAVLWIKKVITTFYFTILTVFSLNSMIISHSSAFSAILRNKVTSWTFRGQYEGKKS